MSHCIVSSFFCHCQAAGNLIWRPGHARHQLAGLTALLLIPLLAVSEPPAYLISTIDTGQVKTQTVLSGFFKGPDSAHIILVTVDEANVRKVSVYQSDDGQYLDAPIVEHVLPTDVISMEVGRISGRDQVVMFGRETAWQFLCQIHLTTKLITGLD